MTFEEYQNYTQVDDTKIQYFRDMFDKHPSATSIFAAGKRFSNADGTATVETIRITRPKD